ncbi:MAG: hypothetical protein C4536_04730 [Actinobacteria bacterium]|jgi:hypothetical protein|nr:MAG: hypothetical protein C4536_04730 [Actinomycetota bacterium]
MRRTIAALLLLLLAAETLAAGCGGGEGVSSPREQSMQATLEGSYQVKGTEDGRTRGVGIYDGGSFRIIPEDGSRMVIYNRDTEEGWLISLATRTYEPISYDEAILKAGFMPEMVMKPYFELEQFWNGQEFRMDTADGRSIRAFLEGPDYLPSAWVAESQGDPLKEISWEYRRVGQVSAANFQLPEGLEPAG